jgi:hypothetical protein
MRNRFPRNCRIPLGSLENVVLIDGGPKVRIHLPPAESLRTFGPSAADDVACFDDCNLPSAAVLPYTLAPTQRAPVLRHDHRRSGGGLLSKHRSCACFESRPTSQILPFRMHKRCRPRRSSRWGAKSRSDAVAGNHLGPSAGRGRKPRPARVPGEGKPFSYCRALDIGNAATSRNEDTARGRLQATGRVEAEPRIAMSSTSRARSSTWPPCRSMPMASSDRHGDQNALYRPRLTPRGPITEHILIAQSGTPQWVPPRHAQAHHRSQMLVPPAQMSAHIEHGKPRLAGLTPSALRPTPLA